MTFKAPGGNAPVKKYLIGWVTWTVTPAVRRSMIRYRKLKEDIFLPEQVGLSLPPRPDNNINRFPVDFFPGNKCALEQSIWRFLQGDL